MSAHQRTPSAAALTQLTRLLEGEIAIEGRIAESSNFTFLVTIEHESERSQAVYKPLDGEQPLWDFPSGLYRREAAAYELSVALGWPDVPETVIREAAPLGTGSLQRFQPSDFREHYFSLFERAELHDALRRVAVFDVLANNADRKSRHCLWGDDAKVYAIDNGLAFHVEPKLRTVIWEFAGETIDDALLDDVRRVRDTPPPALQALLHEDECAALDHRMSAMLQHPVLPELVSDRQYPWPLI